MEWTARARWRSWHLLVATSFGQSCHLQYVVIYCFPCQEGCRGAVEWFASKFAGPKMGAAGRGCIT
jgi:hypothetical protein